MIVADMIVMDQRYTKRPGVKNHRADSYLPGTGDEIFIAK
jgi:hypothetical protein